MRRTVMHLRKISCRIADISAHVEAEADGALRGRHHARIVQQVKGHGRAAVGARPQPVARKVRVVGHAGGAHVAVEQLILRCAAR